MSPPIGIPRIVVTDREGHVLSETPVKSTGLTVGSAAESSILLQSSEVSPTHAAVEWRTDGVYLIDKGSQRGTSIDGVPMLPGIAQKWAMDQRATIGPYQLKLEYDSQPPEPGLDVLVPEPYKAYNFEPGKPVSFPVKVGNRSVVVDEVYLSINGIQSEWIQGLGVTASLLPGATREFTLTVAVPRKSSARAATYNATIVAHSKVAPERPGEAKVVWTIERFDQLNLAVDPPSRSAFKRGRYRVNLANEGSADASYTLSASDGDGELSCLFVDKNSKGQARQAHPVASMGPGETAVFDLLVEAPHLNVQNPRQRYDIPVRATPLQHGQLKTETVAFWKRPLLTFWTVAAVVVPIALAVIIYLWLRPYVHITDFHADRKEIPKGESLTLYWNVTGAKRVQLENEGDLAGSGSRPMTPDASIAYKLMAWGPRQGDEDHRTVSVKVSMPKPTLEVTPSKVKKNDIVHFSWNADPTGKTTLRWDLGKTAELTSFPGRREGRLTGCGLYTFTLESAGDGVATSTSDTASVTVKCGLTGRRNLRDIDWSAQSTHALPQIPGPP